MRSIRLALGGLALTMAIGCGSQQGASGIQGYWGSKKQSKTQSRSLKISTFNVLNYGADKLGKSRNDSRDPRLKDFLRQNLGDSDVIVFQEVVDKGRFEKEVMGSGYECHSYDSWSGHQYVLICNKRKLTFARRWYDDNVTIEGVSMGGKLRPAVHGALKDEHGNWALYIIGVHLKASAANADVRKEQLEIIADEIKKQNGNLPVVITGDFNIQKSEISKVQDVFDENRLGLRHVNNWDATYNDGGYWKKNYDHFWVSKSLRTSGPDVHEMCQNPWSNKNKMKIGTYNQYISDHCPVSITVRY